MRALIQRTSHASVTINDDTGATFEVEPPRTIGTGMVVLLGVGLGDDRACAEKLWSKISKLRIFEDENGKTNLSISDVHGEAIIVSQFTLYADCKKGNRPGFGGAGDPHAALELYRYFVSLASRDIPHVAAGEFGADMTIELANEGPFTIWLDTDAL